MSTYIPSILFVLLVYTLCGTIALRVSLSTKVLARVNKGIIRSIAFEKFVYLLMTLATLEPSITCYYCIKRMYVRILLPVESLLYLH